MHWCVITIDDRIYFRNGDFGDSDSCESKLPKSHKEIEYFVAANFQKIESWSVASLASVSELIVIVTKPVFSISVWTERTA